MLTFCEQTFLDIDITHLLYEFIVSDIKTFLNQTAQNRLYLHKITLLYDNIVFS